MIRKEYVQEWRRKDQPVMTPEELLAAIQKMKHSSPYFTARNQALLTMMYLTAGRCSEVVGQTHSRGVKKGDVTQIEDSGRRFTVIHTDNLKNPDTLTKYVPVPHDRFPDSEFLKIVWDYITKIARTEKLFPITSRRARQLVDQYLGKDYSPHYFRHTRLTHLTQFPKLSPWELTQIAGWRSPKMAMHYIHSDYRTLLDKL